jgi:hypothetical protein
VAVELVDEVLTPVVFFSTVGTKGSAFLVFGTSDLLLQAPNKIAALKINKLCFMNFL